ncbi:MAG: hypothetical protein AABW59_00535 [archaeon]
MDFRIDNGPWETIFTGIAFGHEVEIVVNPEKLYLVMIYEESGGKKIGALIEGYKALVARGHVESFVQTLPKSCMGIEKNFGGTTSKVFFVSIDPVYIDFRQEDYLKRIDKEVQKCYDLSQTAVELARTSSLDLKEPAATSETEYASILSDPVIFRALTGTSFAPNLSKMEFTQVEQPREQLIQLGLSKTREIIRESSRDLYRTLIMSTYEKGTLYPMYIIAENFLLEDKPIVIFDKDNYFDGLGYSSKNELELKESMIDYEPIGFPVKKYVAKKNIRVSLSDVDIVLAMELLGTADPEFEKELGLFSAISRQKTPKALLDKVMASGEFGDYYRLKAERVLNVLDQNFNNMFGDSIDFSDLTKKWPGKLGRATIIDTKDLSFEERIVFTQTVMRLMSKSIKDKIQNEFALFVPFADEMLSVNEDKMNNALFRLENVGVGLILGTKQKLSDELTKTMTANFSVVSARDVAVSIKGKRNYRVMLRPSLSTSQKA